MKSRFFNIVCVLVVFFNIPVMHCGAYSIKDIQVKNLGGSSAAAKEEALKNARKQAFDLMIQKLIDRKEVDRFENVDDQTIEFLIDSMQVIEEKMGAKSYKATLSFEFNKQRMEDFLRNKAVPFISPVHKSVVILPILSDGAKTYLFEKENIWLDLWKHHSFNNALITFIVPNGDLNDINLLDAEDAIIGATHKLVGVATRYQASAIIVPYVSITTDGRNYSIRLDFQEFDAKGIKKNSSILSHSLSEPTSESSKLKMLKSLLPIAINNIQEFSKAQLSGGVQNHNLVYLKVPTSSPQDYYKYIKLLNESNMVQEVQPVELSKGYSVLRVKTQHTLEDLLKYFKERGYDFQTSQEVVNPYAHEAATRG